MRRILALPAISLIALFAACGDDTTGSGGEGGSGGAPTTTTGTTKSSSATTGSSSSTTGNTTNSSASSTSSSTATTSTGMGGEGGDGGMGGDGGGGGMPAGETDCLDGVDNDNDNDTDCADSECAQNAVCGDLVINEIDYDNPGQDTLEFVEVFNVGATTVDLSTVQIITVDGNNSAVDDTYDLSGTIAPGGYVVLANAAVVVNPQAAVIALPDGSLQNGSPDGVVLYEINHGVALDALSYEGGVTAVDINGTTFNLVEGTEAVATDSGEVSMSRIPNGADTNNAAADWAATATLTPGAANVALEVCDDMTDNDGDTLSDCADNDCMAQSCGPNGLVCISNACACMGGTTETTCGDTQDNDCDGQVDCADSDCAADPACSENCSDGMDNDGDTLTDCADPSCANQSCGANGLTCSGTMCVCPGGGSPETVCGDAQDNDCDGQADCADSDCAGSCVAANVWINELHYDNTGTDVNEGVEIAGVAGTDLTGYSLVFYNGGSNPAGQTYLTTQLTGTIPNQQNGFGTLWFPIGGMGIQNGAPDALALVGPGDAVLFFLGYEGTLTASNGPASGQMCVDIGVSQEPAPAIDLTLQLTGTGGSYASFTWAAGVAQTRGAVNVGQTLQ